MRSFVVVLCMLHAAFAAPQFVTFEDGKIGVNFGGYHAEAGLGGLLTGNAAHGGLSASAGTPWGQNAAAGLGGVTGGRTSGVAYAGAQATPEVGASAVLGGTAGAGGFAGSEAHTNRHVSMSTKTVSKVGTVDVAPPGPVGPVGPVETEAPSVDVVQKIKPPKKYSLFRETHSSDTSADRNSATSEIGSIRRVDVAASNQQNDNAAHNHNDNGDMHKLLTSSKARVRTKTYTTTTTTTNGATAATAAMAATAVKQANTNKYGPSGNVANQAPTMDDNDNDNDKHADVVIVRSRQKQRQRQRECAHRRQPWKCVTRSRQRAGNAEQQTQQTQQTQHIRISQHHVVDHPNVVHSKQVSKTVYGSAPTYTSKPTSNTEVVSVNNSGLVTNALNIPIGILRSLQESLGGLYSNTHVKVQNY